MIWYDMRNLYFDMVIILITLLIINLCHLHDDYTYQGFFVTTRLLISLLLFSFNNIRMPSIDSCLSNKNKKKLQTLQNKFLRIALTSPWFMQNKQLHNDTGLSYLSSWTIQQFKNFHNKTKQNWRSSPLQNW